MICLMACSFRSAAALPPHLCAWRTRCNSAHCPVCFGAGLFIDQNDVESRVDFPTEASFASLNAVYRRACQVSVFSLRIFVCVCVLCVCVCVCARVCTLVRVVVAFRPKYLHQHSLFALIRVKRNVACEDGTLYRLHVTVSHAL